MSKPTRTSGHSSNAASTRSETIISCEYYPAVTTSSSRGHGHGCSHGDQIPTGPQHQPHSQRRRRRRRRRGGQRVRRMTLGADGTPMVAGVLPGVVAGAVAGAMAGAMAGARGGGGRRRRQHIIPTVSVISEDAGSDFEDTTGSSEGSRGEDDYEDEYYEEEEEAYGFITSRTIDKQRLYAHLFSSGAWQGPISGAEEGSPKGRAQQHGSVPLLVQLDDLLRKLVQLLTYMDVLVLAAVSDMYHDAVTAPVLGPSSRAEAKRVAMERVLRELEQAKAYLREQEVQIVRLRVRLAAFGDSEDIGERFRGWLVGDGASGGGSMSPGDGGGRPKWEQLHVAPFIEAEIADLHGVFDKMTQDLASLKSLVGVPVGGGGAGGEEETGAEEYWDEKPPLQMEFVEEAAVVGLAE